VSQELCRHKIVVECAHTTQILSLSFALSLCLFLFLFLCLSLLITDTYTHVHTHVHTHAHIQTHTHTHTHVHTHTHTYTHTLVNIDAKWKASRFSSCPSVSGPLHLTTIFPSVCARKSVREKVCIFEMEREFFCV